MVSFCIRCKIHHWQIQEYGISGLQEKTEPYLNYRWWILDFEKKHCLLCRAMVCWIADTQTNYCLRVMTGPTFMPTRLLCWFTLAVTSLPRLFARRRNRLVNLRANLILSPHPPHFHASTLFKCLDSSHVHLSICPLLHPRAKLCTKLADDTA